MDDLGNRDSVNVRDGNDIDYVIDNPTNRYTSIDGNHLPLTLNVKQYVRSVIQVYLYQNFHMNGIQKPIHDNYA